MKNDQRKLLNNDLLIPFLEQQVCVCINHIYKITHTHLLMKLDLNSNNTCLNHIVTRKVSLTNVIFLHSKNVATFNV